MRGTGKGGIEELGENNEKKGEQKEGTEGGRVGNEGTGEGWEGKERRSIRKGKVKDRHGRWKWGKRGKGRRSEKN